MRDAVLFGELTSCHAKFRRLDILARSVVVECDHDLVLIEDFREARLFEHSHRYRCGNVVSEHYVEPGFDKISRMHFRKSCVRREYLLCHCHAHRATSLISL